MSADYDPDDLALTECCIDTCGQLAHVVIESYPDDIGLCRGHWRTNGPLEPFETVRVIGENDER